MTSTINQFPIDRDPKHPSPFNNPSPPSNSAPLEKVAERIQATKNNNYPIVIKAKLNKSSKNALNWLPLALVDVFHIIHNVLQELSRIKNILPHTVPPKDTAIQDPDDNLGQEISWSKEIIKTHKIGSKYNHTAEVIKLALTPDQVRYYRTLQNEIAKIIPLETNRPTFEIHIRKEPYDAKKITKRICMLGAMGVKYDGKLSQDVVMKISQETNMTKTNKDLWEDVEIILYSSPPPYRPKSPSTLVNAFLIYPWWHGVREFVNRYPKEKDGCTTQYIIASNTGHLALRGHFSWDISNLIPGALKPFKDKFQNIPEALAVGLRKANNQSPGSVGQILVVGTTQARNSLYTTSLKKQDLNIVQVPKKDQDDVQKFIDKVKAAKLRSPYDADLQRFKIIVQDIKDEHPEITHIVWGCTEIPMCLSMDPEFTNELEKEAVIINSDEVFRLHIANHILNKPESAMEEILSRPKKKISADEKQELARKRAGRQVGKKIIGLQKELQNPLLSRKRKKKICKNIVKKFNNFSRADCYTQMYEMRQYIDNSIDGQESPLLRLVYRDVDKISGHNIIKAINRDIQNVPSKKIKWSNRVYTDKDDTIHPSLNDTEIDIDGPYPGQLKLNELLVHAMAGKAQNAPTTILTARSEVTKKLAFHSLNKIYKKKGAKPTRYFTLFGSNRNFFIKGVSHYVAIRFVMKKFVKVMKFLAPKGLKQIIKNAYKFIKNLSRRDMAEHFGFDKWRNINRDLLLRPEARPIFFGDTGEGDLFMMLLKNYGSTGAEISEEDFEKVQSKFPGIQKENLVFNDDRIPDMGEIFGTDFPKDWSDANETLPGNPPGRGLYLGLAHAMTNPKKHSILTPVDVQNAVNWDPSNLNTFVYNNSIDAAIFCLQKGTLSCKETNLVIKKAKEWLKNDKKLKPRHHVTAAPSTPAQAFRKQLKQSLIAYDEYIKDLPFEA